MSDQQQLVVAAPDEPAQSSEVEHEGSERDPAPPRRRRRGRRIALITLLVVALLGLGGVGAGAFYLRSVDSRVERVDAFEGVPQEARPPVAAKGAMNILVLGSDSRDPDSTQGSRSDTIIIAHLPKDRKSAELIAIPRDTWVHVPRSKDGKHGDRDAKINAAYAWGGVPLMVQTVEQFTRVRIDHVAIIDFAGFRDIIDAIGGVEIDSERAFTSIHPPFRKFAKGPQHMDGETALDYSRQRKQFPDGDFARIRHQQQVIRAILDKAASGGILTNPGKLNDFVRASSSAVSVDKGMSLLDMATDLRNLRGGNLFFFTSPTKGTGRVGSESVVFPDTAKAQSFYDAVRRDAVKEIVGSARQ
ncbi:LCP family protein [Micromonospora sp. DR5-3]|uniref:LCP family protein n=1 Tax=unclassified Micromonospora TaxID=2617518 RepID=UPI0011D986CD|nr:MULTISPECIES: LCP family protein [unclassified Micromonospora]MCW3815471.1 LCP family protein [Micromonospora sp. DR5-3]TYC24283.1 LytR family transcriptional regulator [Micromonospora sp. MP36]